MKQNKIKALYTSTILLPVNAPQVGKRLNKSVSCYMAGLLQCY